MSYQNLLVVRGDLVVRENKMQIEIEIKAKISSIPKIRKELKKLGAHKKGSKRVVDIYYTQKKEKNTMEEGVD